MASLTDIQAMGSILERKGSSMRMTDRDTAGGRIDRTKVKRKRTQKEHFRKDWDRDLWD
tara:strand:- start:572 stop:748 length:177 start_codon:yes stop_codon:yes gene_type:complete